MIHNIKIPQIGKHGTKAEEEDLAPEKQFPGNRREGRTGSFSGNRRSLQIRGKILASILACLLLCSIGSAVCLTQMKSIGTNYDFALKNYGFSQGDIGNALAYFVWTNGSAHDAVSYFNLQNKALAEQNLSKYADKFEEYMNRKLYTTAL